MKYKERFYVFRRWVGIGPTNILIRFRFDPVPFTGNHKKPIIRFFRRIKTTQERKYSCDPEHKPYIRGKRSLKNLPEAWDDIPASIHENKRSWKRTKKKKQWM